MRLRALTFAHLIQGGDLIQSQMNAPVSATGIKVQLTAPNRQLISFLNQITVGACHDDRECHERLSMFQIDDRVEHGFIFRRRRHDLRCRAPNRSQFPRRVAASASVA
jgi:hypothetical protein